MKGRDTIMTSTGGNPRSSPLSSHQSLTSTLKEHRDLVADYHQQLQQLQQQQQQQQQEQPRHHRRAETKGRRSPRSSDGSASPPESPLHDADQTSDLDEFMESDNEDAGVALDLVSIDFGLLSFLLFTHGTEGKRHAHAKKKKKEKTFRPSEESGCVCCWFEPECLLWWIVASPRHFSGLW